MDEQWTQLRAKWKKEEEGIRQLCEDALKPMEGHEEKGLNYVWENFDLELLTELKVLWKPTKEADEVRLMILKNRQKKLKEKENMKFQEQRRVKEWERE